MLSILVGLESGNIKLNSNKAKSFHQYITRDFIVCYTLTPYFLEQLIMTTCDSGLDRKFVFLIVFNLFILELLSREIFVRI